MAKISNSIGYANANSASIPLLDPAIATDTAVYPTPDQKLRPTIQIEPSSELLRAITRIWQRLKTG